MTIPPANAQLTTTIHSVLPGAMAAWMYGGAASGSMNAESDIDVAFLLPFSDVRKTTSSLKNEAQSLGEISGYSVDLVDFFSVWQVFQKEVTNAGHLLFCADELASGNAELQALCRYCDLTERHLDAIGRVARTGKVHA